MSPPAAQEALAAGSDVNSAAAERRLVFDTETTGLGPGHRVIEIGVVELVGRRITGREFHTYLDPGRDIDSDAQQIHGISREFLRGKPTFFEVAPALLEFLGSGSELIAHNLGFDLSMLTQELSIANLPMDWRARFKLTDTVVLARRQFPGASASLDALRVRYRIPDRRDRHGALVDARILAQIFLELTREQHRLGYSMNRRDTLASPPAPQLKVTVPLVVLSPTPEELAAHETMMDQMETAPGGYCGFRNRWPPPKPSPATGAAPPMQTQQSSENNWVLPDWSVPFSQTEISPALDPQTPAVDEGAPAIDHPSKGMDGAPPSDQGHAAFIVDI